MNRIRFLTFFSCVVIAVFGASTRPVVGQEGSSGCTILQRPSANAAVLSFLKRGDIVKGDYESTADHFARITKLFKAPTEFAIIAPAMDVGEYDADTEELTISPFTLAFMLKDIQLERNYTPIRSYVGENAFGVTRDIQVGRVDRYSVVLDESESDRFGLREARLESVLRDRGDIVIKMPRQTARQTRAALKLVLVAKLAAPFVRNSQRHSAATITNPRETDYRERSLVVDSTCAGILDGKSNQVLALVEANKGAPVPQTELASLLAPAADIPAPDAKDILFRQARECWNTPVGAPTGQDTTVQVRVFLARDGSLAQPPLLEPQTRAAAASNPYTRTAAEAALRAVNVCEPYKLLPVDRYDEWRETVVTFGSRLTSISVPPLSATITPPTPPSPAVALTSHAVGADDYPAISIRLKETGTVAVRFTIDADGSVTLCQVDVSSGKPRLDDAACSFVKRKWKYKPAMQDGKPVPQVATANIAFLL